jgi:1,2-dihydroxy-3-keto-5-methylthiopentene dioxygenase
MATVRIPSEQRTLTDQRDVTEYLATLGIEYERWPLAQRAAANAPPDAVLAAYAPEIEQLKARGGYVTADVIDVTAATPGLDAMLARFSTEHWHDEDEVRFIIRGRGLFHIHPREGGGPVIAIEVEAGDLIRVPRGTWHWFDLCGDRDIRAIRLFQDKAGWTPHYTNSGTDKGFEPLCMGPAYIPLGTTGGARST